MLKALALALAVFMTGCASTPPQLDRDAWMAMTTRTVQAEPEAALKAVERVLRLADESDTKFTHTAEGFAALRKATTYMVIAFAEDFWQWQVTAAPVAGGARLQVQAYHTVNTMTALPIGPIAVPLTTGGAPGVPVSDAKLYELVWARVAHVLDGSQPWVTCKQAGATKMGSIALALCGVGADDLAP